MAPNTWNRRHHDSRSPFLAELGLGWPLATRPVMLTSLTSSTRATIQPSTWQKTLSRWCERDTRIRQASGTSPVADIRPCALKTHADLALEWDQLAEERHRQIASGEDLSFEHVLVPTTLRLLEDANNALVLDIGSGTGDFTARLARIATR